MDQCRLLIPFTGGRQAPSLASCNGKGRCGGKHLYSSPCQEVARRTRAFLPSVAPLPTLWGQWQIQGCWGRIQPRPWRRWDGRQRWHLQHAGECFGIGYWGILSSIGWCRHYLPEDERFTGKFRQATDNLDIRFLSRQEMWWIDPAWIYCKVEARMKKKIEA